MFVRIITIRHNVHVNFSFSTKIVQKGIHYSLHQKNIIKLTIDKEINVQ